MPAMDLALIDKLGRDLHSHSPGYMGEDEVCPWTLFLTMALTLLKGVLPHVPRMLPVLISDPVMRQKVEDTFTSQEFLDNLEGYFVDNIKNDIQAPLNRQIVKSSETIMYFVEMMDKMLTTFMGPHHGGNNDNDIGSTDNRPREYSSYYGNNYFDTAGQILNFAKTAYALFR
jgi:hypothetical protein